MVLGAAGGAAKKYYASLTVINQYAGDIEIKYTANGQEQKQEFPKGSAGGFDVTVQSASAPGPIEFKAYQKGTSNIVQLNGQDSLMVTPTETKSAVSVTAGGGAAGGQYFSTALLAVYFLLCVTIITLFELL